MIKIALCDSDISTLSKHKSWIQYFAKKKNKLFHIQTFKTTSQLLSHFIRVSNLDILIIDPAVLPINSGLTTVKKLRELGCNAEIIYLASSQKYLLEAFDTEPMYYNTKKDMTLESFEKVFMKAVENRELMLASTKMFSVRSGSVIKRIPYDSISYFEISNRITTVNYGKNLSFDFYSTISQLEKQLENNYFLRIHRSIIVNLLYVESYEQKMVHLLTGVSLPVGLTYSQLLIKSLAEL